MKTLNIIIPLLFLPTVLLVAPVRADFFCPFDLNYGLVVSDTQIRVMQKSRTIQQINQQSDLFVAGKLQRLTSEQQQLLSIYAEGLHDLVPKMITLATEGSDIAIDAIERMYTGLVGQDNDSYERVRETMQKTKMRIKEKFRFASGHYFIAAGSLESVDEFVDAAVETPSESSIAASVGSVLSAIGGVDDPAKNNRIETIRDASLSARAQSFCQQLQALDTIEEQLRNSQPALDIADVIVHQSQKMR